MIRISGEATATALEGVPARQVEAAMKETHAVAPRFMSVQRALSVALCKGESVKEIRSRSFDECTDVVLKVYAI